MKFYLPTIGTKIRITAPWKFTLYGEYRNQEFGKIIGLYNNNVWMLNTLQANEDQSSYWRRFTVLPVAIITLSENTDLTVSRIYVRNGAKEFDSITFWGKGIKGVSCFELGTEVHPNTSLVFPKPVSFRFWAKLNEVNGTEFDVIEEVKDKTKK